MTPTEAECGIRGRGGQTLRDGRRGSGTSRVHAGQIAEPLTKAGAAS
jgi:hypothetical protein